MVWVAVDIVTAAVVADGVHGDDYEYEDERREAAAAAARHCH